MGTLIKGTLWERVVKTTERALAAGALFPIPTAYTFIEDGGVHFFVRKLSSLTRKDEARKRQAADAGAGKTVNPFLPPEEDLLVSDITETHLALLNKFNVVEHHLLIVTRHFEEQDMLLTLSDFEALWLCLAEYNGLGFYNGGREAGASQEHKHLQLAPLPLAPEGPPIPIGPLLAAASSSGVCAVPGLPFLHAFVRLGPAGSEVPPEAAKTTFRLYGEMLRTVGMQSPDASRLTRQSRPYCFIITRDWMLLVPRSKEFFEDISINTLAFAGSLFVRNEQQLERLKSVGPMSALASVSLPRPL
jgi:ATP adenylyltransferase